MDQLLANPFFVGVVGGLLGAARVDYMAFRTWKNFDDVHSYDWKTAMFRWLQGAVSGLVGSASLWAAARGISAAFGG